MLEQVKLEEGEKRWWTTRVDIQEFGLGGLGAGALTCWEGRPVLSKGHAREMLVLLV